MHAFNYYGIGTNQNVVIDPDWFSRRWFDYPGQNRARADMTVLADDCPAAQHRAHVNHGVGTDFCTNVDDCPHHDNDIVANQNLIPNQGTRFDPRVDSLQIQQRHG